ncbi:MAG: type IV secretion system protein [Rhodocyclaceae bacterium]|nr:type IV secretion system protein [Rhodocyclaceae bacterium]
MATGAFIPVVSMIIEKVDKVVEGTTQEIFGRLVAQYSTTITTLFVLLIVLYGWGFWHGWVKGTWGEAFSNILKIAFVYYLTMNWANFSMWFYEMYYHGSEEIMNTIAGGTTASGHSNAAMALEKFLTKGTDAAMDMFIAVDGIAAIPVFFIAVILILLVLAVTGIATFLVCLSKLGVAILLSVGIIFIAFLLFEKTRSHFESWIGLLLNYALCGILTVALLQFMGALQEDFIKTITSEGSRDIQTAFWDYAAFIFFCIVFAGLFYFIPTIAGNLSTGYGMGGMGALNRATGATTRFVANRFRRNPRPPNPPKPDRGNNVNPG